MSPLFLAADEVKSVSQFERALVSEAWMKSGVVPPQSITLQPKLHA